MKHWGERVCFGAELERMAHHDGGVKADLEADSHIEFIIMKQSGEWQCSAYFVLYTA